MRLKHYIDEILAKEQDKESRSYLLALRGLVGDAKTDFVNLQKARLSYLCSSFGETKQKITVFNKVNSFISRKKT
ncbi:MAG: hypothetical protein N2645_15185 [Clostridia bacterium]|nr:hypothetical protein [Clostridia bacterium]